MTRTSRLQLLVGTTLFLVAAFAGSSGAQVRDPNLNDSEVPGSIIIFPKFVAGTVTQPGYGKIAQTEIKVGVVCPAAAGSCPAGQRVFLRFHWICPGDSALVCKETDFDASTTVNGKLVFNAAGQMLQGNFLAPAPPCPRGFLVGRVIRPSDGQPIKFDGIFGDAVLRESRTAVTTYKAIPIQAADMGGGYKDVTGVIKGDVQYDRLATGTKLFQRTTSLILLTLNVLPNRPNYPTVVDLDFYSATEVLHSASTRFVCWQEIAVSAIDPGLTELGVGTRDGVVISGPANKITFGGIADTAGPVSLLGLVETVEGNVSTSPITRAYIHDLYNDGEPIPTVFP